MKSSQARDGLLRSEVNELEGVHVHTCVHTLGIPEVSVGCQSSGAIYFVF